MVTGVLSSSIICVLGQIIDFLGTGHASLSYVVSMTLLNAPHILDTNPRAVMTIANIESLLHVRQCYKHFTQSTNIIIATNPHYRDKDISTER